jgi:LmbE family N-acetylglucosaminyl deacetylase
VAVGVAIVCSTLSTVCSLQAQERVAFDVRQDYRYELGRGAAEVAEVVLDSTGFAWPEGAAAADTAYLELHLVKTKGPEPGVRVLRAGVELHQFFERGARGLRFVDLSPIAASAPAAGERVTLEGAGSSWRVGSARLVLYRNSPLAGRRVLVIAPHPDDAEIAAFGAYRSSESDVVTVTAGDAGGRNFEVLFPDPGEHFRIKGWTRTWDSITVPFFGDVRPGRARNLGYYDATLARLYDRRPMPVAPPLAVLPEPGYYRSFNVDEELRRRPFEPTWPALVADLESELSRVQPDVVVAPHPLLDAHRDHQFTTIALIEALARWPGRCELYLYTNHAVANESFPLGPARGMTGLPPWAGGELYFERLHSHPLSADDRRLKLMALEAMHDLRPFDPRDGSREPPTRRELRESLRYDYFRRGPRPNELFFVVTKPGAQRLREAFLAAREARAAAGG